MLAAITALLLFGFAANLPKIPFHDGSTGRAPGAAARSIIHIPYPRERRKARMGKREDKSDRNGGGTYDTSKTKPVEEAGGGKHDKDDNGGKK